MAIINAIQTIGGILIVNVDSNPITGLGTSSPIGSIATAIDGSGMYYKSGVLDTNWNILGNISGSGTLNYLAKFTPNGINLGNSLIFDNGTYVGIGISAPTSTLHIKGVDSTSSNFSLKIDNSSSSPLFYVRNDGIVLINSSYNNAQLNISTPSSPSYVNAIFGDATLSNGFGIYGVGNYGVVGYTITTAYGNAIYGNASSIPYTGTGGYFIGGLNAIVGKSSTHDVNSTILQLVDNNDTLKFRVLGSGETFVNGAGLNILGKDSLPATYSLLITNSSTDVLFSVQNGKTIIFGNSTYEQPVLTQTNLYITTPTSVSSLLIQCDDTGGVLINYSASVYTAGIFLDITNGHFSINTTASAIDINQSGIINLTSTPTGNAGLVSGNLYFDTAANILANGDLVVGMKV